jgi:hypothetical protein
MNASSSAKVPISPAIRRAVTFAFALTPAATLAQQPAKGADEPIPRELVLALLNLGPGMSAAADIRVGAAPDDIPPELIPPGSRVLGSTTQFESAVLVLVEPQSPDSAISAYEAKLLAAGWTKAPSPPSPPLRGFVSAERAQVAFDRPDIVCRGDAFATFASAYRRIGGGSLLKVTYNRGGRYSMCRSRQETTSTYRSPYDEAPIPVLRSPPGAIMDGGSGMSASSNFSFSLTTVLSTKLRANEVVAHYDKQMREQGWASLGDGATPFVAAHAYQRSDDQGRTWSGLLFSVSFPDSSKQDVTLRVQRSQQAVAK